MLTSHGYNLCCRLTSVLCVMTVLLVETTLQGGRVRLVDPGEP